MKLTKYVFPGNKSGSVPGTCLAPPSCICGRDISMLYRRGKEAQSPHSQSSDLRSVLFQYKIFMSFPCTVRTGFLSKNTGEESVQKEEGARKTFVSVENEEKKDQMDVLSGSH